MLESDSTANISKAIRGEYDQTPLSLSKVFKAMNTAKEKKLSIFPEDIFTESEKLNKYNTSEQLNKMLLELGVSSEDINKVISVKQTGGPNKKQKLISLVISSRVKANTEK